MTSGDHTPQEETKEDIAREIAEIVDGVDPNVYKDNDHGVYFDRDDLSALKRWIAENDDSLPEEEQ